MRLSLLELEARETPSVYDVGYGVLHLATGHEYQVFSDYRGPLVWLQNVNGVTTVAPAPDHGGGPRVATIDTRGNRTQPDYFSADPSSRAGVALIDTGGTVTQSPSVPSAFVVPDLTRGNTGDPNTWPVYLDFQHPSSAEWVTDVVDEVWRIVGRSSCGSS